MLWHVHVIVKGAKVSPPQTVQTVDLLLSGPLLHTSNQSVNTMRWPLHSDKPSVVLCLLLVKLPCSLHKDYTKLLLIVLIDFCLLHLGPTPVLFFLLPCLTMASVTFSIMCTNISVICLSAS